jgi:O-antigen/teichoic acid export membrane protein
VSSEIRNVGKHTLVYGIGIVLGKLASFLMLPVYTRYLTPADYGTLELLGTTIDVIGMIAGIGLASGVFKYYAEFDDPHEKNEVISTVALGTAGLALVTAGIGILLSPVLTRLLLEPATPSSYFRLFFLIYFFNSTGGIPFQLLRAQQRSTLFVALNAAKLVAMLSLNIYLVVVLRMGILGVLVSNLVVSATLTLFLLTYTFRQVGFRFSWEKFRELSRFGAPLIVWSLGSFILTFSDRYFLNYYAGPAAVGIYSLAYKLGFLVSTFAVLPFNLVWDSRRYEIAKQPEAPWIFSRVFFYLSLMLGIVGTGVALFSRDVLTVMADPAFVPAYQVVPLILVAIVLQEWTGYCNIGLYLKNATRLYARSAVIGVVAVTVLNVLLIPRYGMFGAAWATVGGYAIRFAAVYLFSQSQYRLGYPWGPVLRLHAVFAAVLAVRFSADALPLGLSLFLSTVLMTLALLAVYEWFLTEGERAAVRNLLRRPVAALAVRAA